MLTGSQEPLRSLHVVQIGRDESVFLRRAEDEPAQRQQRYGQLLSEERPGSQMTLLILTAAADTVGWSWGCVRFVPLQGRLQGWGRLGAWARLWRALRDTHQDRAIDVLTTQTVEDEAWVVLFFGWVHDVPVVGQVHYDLFSPAAQQEHSRNVVVRWMRTRLTRFFLPAFHAVRVVGQRIGMEIERRGLNRHVRVLPVMVPLAVGHRESWPVREPVVLFVGRLCAAKNLLVWLEVAARVARAVPSASFAIIGEGPLRRDVEERARGLGLSVRFHGYLPNAALVSHYRSAGAFLLTSHYEGFARVVVEAQANGLPVVVPRISGVEDIVVHQTTGFIHDPGDIEGMAESVVALLRNPNLVGQMGRQGHNRVITRFEPNRLAAEWVRMLTQHATKLHRRAS